jgi:hypothetical protein
VVVIVWQLGLQLPVQSVHITFCLSFLLLFICDTLISNYIPHGGHIRGHNFKVKAVVVVVIVWQLGLQLPVQSVHITTKGVNSNPVHGEMYSI